MLGKELNYDITDHQDSIPLPKVANRLTPGMFYLYSDLGYNMSIFDFEYVTGDLFDAG